MNSKYIYLHTIGCQMNVYDSEQIAMRLATLGYEQTSSMAQADVIIVNTCTVRAKAEQKVFSLVGRLRDLKRKRPGLLLVMAGCIAQKWGEELLKKFLCLLL